MTRWVKQGNMHAYSRVQRRLVVVVWYNSLERAINDVEPVSVHKYNKTCYIYNIEEHRGRYLTPGCGCVYTRQYYNNEAGHFSAVSIAAEVRERRNAEWVAACPREWIQDYCYYYCARVLRPGESKLGGLSLHQRILRDLHKDSIYTCVCVCVLLSLLNSIIKKTPIDIILFLVI